MGRLLDSKGLNSTCLLEISVNGAFGMIEDAKDLGSTCADKKLLVSRLLAFQHFRPTRNVYVTHILRL